MTDPTPETAAQTEARSGRGPTRPAVKFADLCDDVTENPDMLPHLAVILANGFTAEDAERRSRDLSDEADKKMAEAKREAALAMFVRRADAIPGGRKKLLAYLRASDETETI